MSVDLEALYQTERLSALHSEIELFAADVVPTPEEKVFCEDLVTLIDSSAAEVAGRRAKVAAFGSYAMGLSTHASDLDLVILNVIRVHSDGLNVSQKARAIRVLYAIARRLVQSQDLKLSFMHVVAQARVPVLKIATKDGSAVDLSLHNAGGVRAAEHMRKTLPKFPAAVPVILVLKCLLKQAKLDEVSLGGLGGYALTNMVLAHCMELRRLGRPDLDYGDVLLGFLETFGYRFDFVRHAVSTRRGDVAVKKSILEKETLEWIRDTDGWQGRTNGKRLPFIEDPLTGRNLAMGTSRFLNIQRQFRQAFDVLQQKGTDDGPLLSRLFDVEGALRRTYKPQRTPGMLPVRKALSRWPQDRQKALESIRESRKNANRRTSHRRSGSTRRRPRAVVTHVAQPSHPSHRWLDMTSRTSL